MQLKNLNHFPQKRYCHISQSLLIKIKVKNIKWYNKTFIGFSTKIFNSDRSKNEKRNRTCFRKVKEQLSPSLRLMPLSF